MQLDSLESHFCDRLRQLIFHPVKQLVCIPELLGKFPGIAYGFFESLPV